MFKQLTLTLMTTGRSEMKHYRKARKTINVTVGESVRIIRELQELSQNELAKITGIPQSTISGIENDRIQLGVERAKVLAKALKCHPAVLVFPGWEIKNQSAA
jgi:transcriptional regulator with XRE-family HTH domain